MYKKSENNPDQVTTNETLLIAKMFGSELEFKKLAYQVKRKSLLQRIKERMKG